MRLSFKMWLVLFLSALGSQQIGAQTKSWSLAQCIDTAILNNLNVLQGANTIELNRLGLKQSKNNLLPSVNGSLSEALGIGRMVNPVTQQYQTGTTWTTGAGLIVTQNLFAGLQYLNAIKQSELIYRSSRYDFEDVKFNLTISVVNGFLQILYTGEAIKIAQTQLSLDSSQLQTTSDLAYVGKRTQSDLLQIKAQLHADQYTVVNAQSQWRLAKVNLQQLMNLPMSDAFDIDYNTAVEPSQTKPDDVSSIYSQSLGFQPIIKSYDLKTLSALYAVKIAKGAYYPQLMFKGTFGTDYVSSAKQSVTTYSSTLQNIGYLQINPAELVMGNVPQVSTSVNNYPFGNQLKDNLYGNFSIGLSIPILNYLQVRNNVKKQEVNLNNAALNENIIKLNLRKTIEQVYTNAGNSEALYRSAQEEVDASKAAYDISVARFEEGKEITTDLLVQKSVYIKAVSDYLQAKYGLLFNTKILDYYKGIPITF